MPQAFYIVFHQGCPGNNVYLNRTQLSYGYIWGFLLAKLCDYIVFSKKLISHFTNKIEKNEKPGIRRRRKNKNYANIE